MKKQYQGYLNANTFINVIDGNYLIHAAVSTVHNQFYQDNFSKNQVETGAEIMTNVSFNLAVLKLQIENQYNTRFSGGIGKMINFSFEHDKSLFQAEESGGILYRHVKAHINPPA